jgi:hypothetical protein
MKQEINSIKNKLYKEGYSEINKHYLLKNISEKLKEKIIKNYVKEKIRRYYK